MPTKTTISQDARNGVRTIKIYQNQDDAAAVADKVRDILASSDAMVKVKDARTDAHILFNSMKTVDIKVEEVNQIGGDTQ